MSGLNAPRALAIAGIAAGLQLCAACSSDSSPLDEISDFESRVASTKLGSDTDHWIEMQNMSGEWERVGLIFGYLGDYEECLNAIKGLKQVNFQREYRCVPAQSN